MLKKLCLLFISIIVVACSSAPKVIHLPQEESESKLLVITQQSPKSEKSLLAIEFQSEQWRWVQTDPLGAPISRLILNKKGWQNDGFVMPNKQAQQLFAAIATYLSPAAIFDVQNKDNQYMQNNQFMWQLSPQKNGVIIELGDKSIWLVEPLEP